MYEAREGGKRNRGRPRKILEGKNEESIGIKRIQIAITQTQFLTNVIPKARERGGKRGRSRHVGRK